MFGSVASKLFGSVNDRALKSLRKNVSAINALEPEIQKLSDDELKGQTLLFKEQLTAGKTLDDILPRAFACVREAARRTLSQRHFDVQLIGGMILHSGKIAEMKTGEGKTLVATLAVYLNALEGKGVHVVTVNDYLAQRDANWMSPVYHALGLTVGHIVSNLSDEQRRKAYACDITYGTNNELGFDYLRDNMKFRLTDMVQRGFNFAIVDEVDSILVDEARTPLIISGSIADSAKLYQVIDRTMAEFEPTDYDLDEKTRNISLTEHGNIHAEDILRQHGLLKDGGLYDVQNITLVHHINQALRAHKLFHKDVDYIVKDDAVIIIDEFTGRMMEGRRYSEGLHQALEAKENVRVQNENQTLASITFQNYFRLYPKLGGMTGTAMTEAAEFETIYGLRVVEVPTNVMQVRKDQNDEIFRSAEEKYEAIVNLIRQCQARQQPILVGTTSIEKSELLAARLKRLNIPHNVLNARYHEQEAYIVAQAGRPGAVTIATNMAGRGTDIKLGGNLEMRLAHDLPPEAPEDIRHREAEKIRAEIAEAARIVREAGGLYVIGTERHESRRIDNQLRGRSGRQGDPGESKFFISLEDDLMRIFGSERMDAFLGKMGVKRGQPIMHPWINTAIERAQKKVEAQHFEIRKNLLKFDNVMNDQRKVIYEQRREIMSSDDLSDVTTDMRHETIEELVARCVPPNSYPDQWDVATFKSEAHRLLAIDIPLDAWAKEEGIAAEDILEKSRALCDERMAHKSQGIPATIMRQIEKSLLLQILDQTWKEHLLNLEYLRQGILLRAFGQRDPLNEYKTESFTMFHDMLARIRENVTIALSVIEIKADSQPPALPETPPKNLVFRGGSLPPPMAVPKAGPLGPVFDQNDPSTWVKTQRNSPCPCGSGKKYKHCHGQSE